MAALRRGGVTDEVAQTGGGTTSSTGILVVVTLAAGTLVSVCGDQVAAIALVLSAAARHSAILVTTLFVVELLPGIVLGTWLGRLVDRLRVVREWPVALLGQAASIGAAAVVPGLWPKAGLVGVAACFGVATSSSGFRALRELAGAGTGWLNAVQGAARSTGGVAGAALGGVGLAAIGLDSVLALDAASFVIFAAAVSVAVTTSTRRAEEEPAAPPPVVRRRAEELRLLLAPAAFGRPGFALVLAVVVSTSFEGVVGVFYLRNTAHISATAYGVVLACWSAGSALAATALARSTRSPARALLAPTALGIGAAIGATAGLTDPWVIGTAYVVGGAANGAFNVALANTVHGGVPEQHLGAAWGVLGTILNTCVLVGYLGGAPGAADARLVLALAGGVCVAAALLALLAGPGRRL